MQAPTVRSLSLLVGTVSVVWAASACSGKVVFEQSNSGGSGGAGSAQTSTHAVATGAVNGSGVGTGNAVATGNTVGTGNVSGVGTSSGSVSNQVSSSGSGIPTPPVFCNGGPCMPNDVCCFNPNGPGDHCGTSGQCDPGFVELSCSSPADCPNAICCGTLSPNMPTYQGISCQATCDAPNEIVICSKTQPDVCPNGTQCHKSQQLGDGYRVCF